MKTQKKSNKSTATRAAAKPRDTGKGLAPMPTTNAPGDMVATEPMLGPVPPPEVATTSKPETATWPPTSTADPLIAARIDTLILAYVDIAQPDHMIKTLEVLDRHTDRLWIQLRGRGYYAEFLANYSSVEAAKRAWALFVEATGYSDAT